jgi:predicted nucleic acid-binding protein
MNLYAESSAVLAWLLEEPGGRAVNAVLRDAKIIVSSELTLVECDRAIHRGSALKLWDESRGKSFKAELERAGSSWIRLRLQSAIIARARRPFPREPIRSLDALHVASALHARADLPDIHLLTLDARIRDVGESLGFSVLPT